LIIQKLFSASVTRTVTTIKRAVVSVPAETKTRWHSKTAFS
jgi:hypothetical protein